ncbi:hypothetical protein EJ03DRAFT_333814 [Teratosphaeria nubilosa]|uniref:Uncharacterized protein n=1 Tax=Teratosphaeria nubilosa TaxID=161662 RepID=A0A6G1LIM8_9PEZI|nr:hypothetical protein EJ03DRAFT_333814 [Teratosphaeria nubilosa]
MADEALRTFEALLESVPAWIADLERILKAATEKQNEVLFENQPAEVEAGLEVLKKKTTSSSLRSRRSKDERNDSGQEKVEESQPPTLLRPQLPHMTNSDALRLSQRKRKTASVDFGDESGPHKFRSKAMVVVCYDGDTQKKFETLVRAIGTCRNFIRKGKMSARVDSLSRSDSLGSEESNSSGGEEAVVELHKISYRSTRLARVHTRHSGNDVSLEAFDKVDGCLEKGQSLCERAAHQILRDGDCALELNNAKSQFTDAQEFAKAEIPVLKKRAEEAAERHRRDDERRRDDEEDRRNRTSAALSLQKVPSLVSSLPSDGKLEVDLEADDDSDGDDDFLADAMQLGKYQMRTTRLLAH